MLSYSKRADSKHRPELSKDSGVGYTFKYETYTKLRKLRLRLQGENGMFLSLDDVLRLLLGMRTLYILDSARLRRGRRGR